MANFTAALLLIKVVVLTALAYSTNNDCAGVTNSNTSGNPCVKVEYYLGAAPWNIWCTVGTSGVCQDGTQPGYDTTKYTFTPCTSPTGVSSNGGRPKNKTCS